MPPHVGFLTRQAIDVGRPPLGAAFLVLEVVGTDVEDGRNVLVVLRLVGLLARDNQRWRWLCDRVPVCGPWVGETLHRVWVLVSWGVCVWPIESSRWGLGRLCAPAVSAVLGHWRATGGADERQRERQRYRQSMTPVGDAVHECRMQFP